MKNLIFSQTKDKFDKYSTWSTFKYSNYEIQNKKVKSFSIIKKLGSFFDFHTKRPKLQNRGMQLVALILGFGVWNFACDIIMNHINDFLLIKLDLKEEVWIPNALIFIIIILSILKFLFAIRILKKKTSPVQKLNSLTSWIVSWI